VVFSFDVRAIWRSVKTIVALNVDLYETYFIFQKKYSYFDVFYFWFKRTKQSWFKQENGASQTPPRTPLARRTRLVLARAVIWDKT